MGKKIIKIGEDYLTIHHYKEPLKSIPKVVGVGFYGCLLGTIDGAKVQCHICGGLYDELQAHVRQSHKLSVPDYREKFELSPSTSLISEERREIRKQNMLRLWHSLTPEEKRQVKNRLKDVRKFRSNLQPKEKLEAKNKKGTCPDQLLAKIQEVSEKLGGRTPSLAEFIDLTGGQRFKHLIFATFGSWKGALEILKMKPKEKIRKGYRRYTDEELLEYLRLYSQENNSLPTATDCKRGWLPTYETFSRRFGSFEKARQLAGVYQIIN